MTYAVIGFYILFFASVFFSVVTVLRPTKFSVIWATIAFVFWVVLAQVTPWVFASGSTSHGSPFVALAFLWYMVGIVFEVLGVTFSLLSLKADRQGRDLQV